MLHASFGAAAWWWIVFLADCALSDFINRPRRELRAAQAAALLAFACLALDLVTRGGGKLGAVLGGTLFGLIGIAAYFLAAAIGIVVVAVSMGAERRHSTAARLRRAQGRLIAAWRVATLEEQRLHALEQVTTSRTQREQLLLSATGRAGDRELMIARRQSSRASSGASSFTSTVVVADSDADDGAADELSFVSVESEPEPQQTQAVETLHALPELERAALIDDEEAAEQLALSGFKLPPAALLGGGLPDVEEHDEAVLQRDANKLTERLAGYDIKGTLRALTPGPVVTTFEFEPSAQTRLATISKLVPELSMVLERGVRILAPLPGTPYVGFELPKPEGAREIVSLRELLEDARWSAFAARASLPIALGKNTLGEPVYSDLSTMPHLLVGGASDQGKSVGLNAMLLSLMLSRTPDQVRFIILDPKVVEFAEFAEIPNLIAPISKELPEAVGALEWAIEEMERRYRIFATKGARKLSVYNTKPGVTPLPYIVIVVDELADLVLTDQGKRVEAAIQRLGQKARAAGIHLIVATQRPSVDVVTGTIKNNFLGRVSYRVEGQNDSKTILGRVGAERLLGKGDALCKLPGVLDMQRVHGAFVSDEDVQAVCEYLRAQGAPIYDPNVFVCLDETQTEPSVAKKERESFESFYKRACTWVSQLETCSASLLQREMTPCGYNRAARVIERMEREGIVGPEKPGGGKRDVLRRAA